MRYAIIILSLIGGIVAVSSAEASALVSSVGEYHVGYSSPLWAVAYRRAAVVRRGAVGYRGGGVVGYRGATVVRRGAVGYRGGAAAGYRGATVVRGGEAVGAGGAVGYRGATVVRRGAVGYRGGAAVGYRGGGVVRRGGMIRR
jgi:hypothetical protein